MAQSGDEIILQLTITEIGVVVNHLHFERLSTCKSEVTLQSILIQVIDSYPGCLKAGIPLKLRSVSLNNKIGVPVEDI